MSGINDSRIADEMLGQMEEMQDEIEQLMAESSNRKQELETSREETRKQAEENSRLSRELCEARETISDLSSLTQELKTEFQKTLSINQDLQTELQKAQSVNQYLTQNNDELRKGRGLLTGKEQQELEERLEEAEARNCDLLTQIDKSSVEAVDRANAERDEAVRNANEVSAG